MVTAHNGCLQFEVTLHGLASHAAYPETGVDALQAANRLLTALYAHNDVLRTRRSAVAGITHPYLNVGRIEGGSNTNVVPGKVVLKIDRRMIPEEDAGAVEAEVRELIERTVAASPGIRVEIRRLLLAHALKPLPGNAPLVAAVQRHGQAVFGEPIPDQRHAAVHRRAAVRRARRAGGDLRRRPAHRAGEQRQARRRAPAC